jgi:hypothetical protein
MYSRSAPPTATMITLPGVRLKKATSIIKLKDNDVA